jgi:hypothetical protein
MLHCTFRNLTAEAGWVAWGVFGTNLNKDFRLENCRLNRVDVHFHCWNLYMRDCSIGFKGITVTGGGDLHIENTIRHGNSFIGFRRDYGAKWDGHVRLRGCTLRPSSSGTTAVLSYHPADFDYRYPIGFARSISIEDMRIDYQAVPDSNSPCWLVDVVSFSQTESKARLFFPQRIEFRNVSVDGRTQGVRLMRIVDPVGYDLRRRGDYDGNSITPNCELICERVQLEALSPQGPDDAEEVHLVLGGKQSSEPVDKLALFPRIHLTDCDHVCLLLQNCIASAHLERCTVNLFNASNLRGELRFSDCHLQPRVQRPSPQFYAVDCTLGTRFTNCTIHAPIIDGVADPEMIDRMGFLEINKRLQHFHLNTSLDNQIINHLRATGSNLSSEFIAKLKSHHALEDAVDA